MQFDAPKMGANDPSATKGPTRLQGRRGGEGQSGKGRERGAWVRSKSHRAVVTAVVREARKASGQTQRELAAALGKPPSFVAKVEQLERRLT